MTRRILVLALMGAFLTACGARGALQPPPGAPEKQPDREIVLDPLIKAK